MPTQWEQRFAQRVQGMKSSAIRELLKVTEQPEIISFAGGLPAPEVFPVEQVKLAAQKALTEHGEQALQYGATEGYRPLREWIARRMSRGTVKLSVENVLIVSGSQQALDLLGKILIDPGDRIIVEAPTYMGALQAWNPYGPAYVTVAADAQGLRTDELDVALQGNARYLYVLPNFQNPTGVTLSAERRLALLSKMRQTGVPVIEDDPYAELRFEGTDLPALLTLEGQSQQEEVYDGNVIYLGTFSKILAPGMRLGWVIAPPAVIQKLVQAKQGADLHTASFTQVIAYELAREGFLDRHVELIRDTYRSRRDAMLEAMEEHFPTEVQWTHPEGGMFLWVTLPEGIDATYVLRAAVKQSIIFVPGESFYPDRSVFNTLRLNYSHDQPERIREGIVRLARVLRSLLYSQV